MQGLYLPNWKNDKYMSELLRVKSIHDAHDFFGLGKPKHPLVTVIHFSESNIRAEYHNIRFISELYYIGCKSGVAGSMGYGRSTYDFQEGVMLFTKPEQVLSYDGHDAETDKSGWALLFHPDLIRKTEFGQKIDNYSFFDYGVSEALHISEEEKMSLLEVVTKIEKEYEQMIDRHSQNLITSNINLLLDYCSRYFDRQFYTRTNMNKDVLVKFEDLLKDYYANEKQLKEGIPTVAYCGEELSMSSKYLSDLLKKETGVNAKSHIDNFLINKAKNSLLASSGSVSEVAYSLGFEYSQHFAKMFKAKTGMSPSEYRKVS